MDPNHESARAPTTIAVLTSGGDAQGMNAVLRAVVRTAIGLGAEVYAVREGLQGLVDGGDSIVRFSWDSVGSILHRGGTVIGTARCQEFRERSGLLKAARNLVSHGIDRLVVIGGDGSLSGADELRANWQSLLDELVQRGDIDAASAARHRHLMVAGVVGSIDNDMVGTDMTVGADTALHRIVEAIDAISSTAASHQRSFVVEVMGRHCGYLALMSAIAGGADYALIPENPPADGWEDEMCALLRAGRAAGRRESIVIVAEGSQDRAGREITSTRVCEVLRERLGEDTRVTILGHVQRGGAPSAYDRWMPTLVGHAAAKEVVEATVTTEPALIGVKSNRIVRTPLMEAVAKTRLVPKLIEAGSYAEAMATRGNTFVDLVKVFEGIARTPPVVPGARKGARIAIVHAGGLAPGMNAAVRAAVRFGMSRGHTMLGIRNSFQGLVDGNVHELGWGDVEGWETSGGAELGTSRNLPDPERFWQVSNALETHRIDAVLMIGGHSGYWAANAMLQERERHPGFRIPLMCLPTTIDNNLPGVDLTIGADSALNVIVEAVDRVKQSAMASRRAFVVEVMGRHSGYLAAMGGLSVGAERVYLHEEGVRLADLARDASSMIEGFRQGRRFYLAIRNEYASEGYTTDVMCRLFEEEAGGEFEVRPLVLGHVQQGGNPSPFDRIHATRLAAFCVDRLSAQIAEKKSRWEYVVTDEGTLSAASLRDLPDVMDKSAGRPKEQWWLTLRTVMDAVANPPAAAPRRGAAGGKRSC